MKVFFSFFLGFVFVITFSQNHLTEREIDSLQSTIVTTNAKNSDKIESISTCLYQQSKEINYKKGQIVALLRRIAYRINTRNYKNVQEDLAEVEDLCKETEDYFHLTKAKAMEVSMLTQLDLFPKAEKLLNENFKLIPKIKELNQRRFMETYYYARYITLYDDKDSLFHYSQKRLAVALKLPNTDRDKPLIIVSTAGYLCKYYSDIQNKEKFNYYLNVQGKYIKKIDNLFDLYNYHKRKAEFIHAYQRNEKSFLDSTLYHFKKAENYAKLYGNPDFLEVLYPEIAQVYEDKKELDKQQEYTKKFVKISDSIVNTENKEIGKIVFKDKNKHKEEPKSFFTFILVGFGIILLGVVIFVKKFQKKSFNEEKPEIISVLENPHFEALRSQALQGNVGFMHDFVEAYPDFRSDILNFNPNLTPSEIEFCALIKMQLSSHEISKAKKMSIRAVDSKRYRIRKKMNIPQGTNLHEFLFHI